MRENPGEVITGALVLAVAIGFLGYAASATGFSRGAGGYELTASFRSAEGVRVGTDVRLAGVRIGTVTGLGLNPDTYRADAVLTLAEGVGVPEDSSAVVASEGLLGGTFLEIVPGASFDMLPPGAQIVDTQGAVSLLSLLMAFAGGGETSGADQ